MSHHWGNWGNNQLPVPNAKVKNAVCVSREITFDGSDSYDPDGTITEWRWDPGDGTGYLYGEVVTHTYASGGNRTVTLRVTDNNGATAETTASASVKDGHVFGRALFPDGDPCLLYSDGTPLNGLKITVTMYYLDASGSVKYSYTYPSVHSSSSGYYEVDVSSNPFSIFSFDYWEYIWYGGWNRVSINGEACNNQRVYLSNISFYRCTHVDITMHHHHTHKLTFQDAQTLQYLDGVTATYTDTYTALPYKTSGTGSSVQWSDAHPLYITNRCTKPGYKVRTPIFDHRGTDVSITCFKEEIVLMDKLVTNAVIAFDKPSYLPGEVMHISYDTMFVLNCKVKVYDAAHNMLSLNLCNGYTNSPPTVDYSLEGSLIYGQWLAVLEDAGGNELAHATAFVGTQGNLSYDTSMRCTEKKIKILWEGINPVFKAGVPPNNMQVKLYDGANYLRGTCSVPSSSGFWYYTFTGAENYDAQWKAVLIDQWGYTVDTIYISVYKECNQAIMGHVNRRDGTPVESDTITMDLTFMGYGVKTAVTNNGGFYALTDLPPVIPLTDITASKTGFKPTVQQVSIEPNELRTVDFIIEGLIRGTVKDTEGTEINSPSVFRTEGSSYVFAVYTDGVYDIECPPGDVTIKCTKKNFQDYSAALTIAASQITHDIVLSRPVPDTRFIAVETAEASLDDTDDNAVFNSSGQSFVVLEQSIVETQHAYAPWGKYQTVMYSSKKYFAGYTTNSFISNYQKISALENNRLHTVLIDDSAKRTISVGGTLTLKGGYVLKVKDVDGNARTVRLALLYYGDEVDDVVVSAGQTYIYHSSEGALAGLPIIAAHILDVFSGRETNAAFIDGVFQISVAYIAIDGQVTPTEKYFLRSGSRDATGAYQLDSSSNIVIEK